MSTVCDFLCDVSTTKTTWKDYRETASVRTKLGLRSTAVNTTAGTMCYLIRFKNISHCYNCLVLCNQSQATGLNVG